MRCEEDIFLCTKHLHGLHWSTQFSFLLSFFTVPEVASKTLLFIQKMNSRKRMLLCRRLGITWLSKFLRFYHYISSICSHSNRPVFGPLSNEKKNVFVAAVSSTKNKSMSSNHSKPKIFSYLFPRTSLSIDDKK